MVLHMTKPCPVASVGIAACLWTAGCGTDVTDENDPTGQPDSTTGTEPGAPGGAGPLTLASDIQPILDTYCVRCHAAGVTTPHGNYHLTADSSAASLGGVSACTNAGTRVRFVVAGRPEDSFLLYKLGATSNLVITGASCEEKMPVGADEPLAVTDAPAVETIRQWILDGAR